MSSRSPLPRVHLSPPRGRVLLLAPHADDDLIGAGGTVAAHIEQGDAVRVVVAYDGAAGDPQGRYPRAELIELRRREARAGGAHLGLRDYEFWDYPEGHEPGSEELWMGAERLAQLVRSFAPDRVYAPWIGEQHLDHWVLARVARLGLALARFQGVAWGYEVWTPLVPTEIVDVSRFQARKERGLGEHHSQIGYTDLVHVTLGLQAQRSAYLAKGARYGEAFRPLGAPQGQDLALLEART